MKDSRGPLPLDDRDFAEIRRNVLEKIERRRTMWPYALAAAAVIALVVFLIPRPAPVPVPVKHVETGFSPSPQPQPLPAPQPKVAVKPKPRKPQQLIASAGAPPTDNEITMNIETADPNVRIIWIGR